MAQFTDAENLASVRTKINAAIAKTDGDAQMVLQPGTAAAPGAAFKDDLDTGWFRADADTLGVSTGGSERLRVHPTGGVSVGTTVDPGAGNARVAGTMTHGTMTLTGGTQNWTVTPSGTTLTFAYNGVNVMRLSSNGDLEIAGTLTESALL